MDRRIEQLTALSVARGVGFAALAVFCVMVGFAGDAVNVLRAGGFGCLLICVVLFFKGINATPEKYKRTEVWIMLDKSERPPPDVAAAMITRARRLSLLQWSHWAAWAAALMLAGAVLLLLVN